MVRVTVHLSEVPGAASFSPRPALAGRGRRPGAAFRSTSIPLCIAQGAVRVRAGPRGPHRARPRQDSLNYRIVPALLFRWLRCWLMPPLLLSEPLRPAALPRRIPFCPKNA